MLSPPNKSSFVDAQRSGFWLDGLPLRPFSQYVLLTSPHGKLYILYVKGGVDSGHKERGFRVARKKILFLLVVYIFYIKQGLGLVGLGNYYIRGVPNS